jgi:hypothetical protein
VAELAKGVFDQARREFEAAEGGSPNDEPSGAHPESMSDELEPITEEPEPVIAAREPLLYKAGLREDAEPTEDDDHDLPTLPPTRPDLDEDDDPTIVEPFAYFARDDGSTDRPSDERPTDRAFPAAAPVAVDPLPAPPPAPMRGATEPRRPPEPPPAPRAGAGRDFVPTPISYPPSAAPEVRVMAAEAAPAPPSVPPLGGPGSISAVAMAPNQHGQWVAIASRAAPSAPPAAPVFSSQAFRASQRPSERAKFSNFAAGVVALLVVGGAGYLGAMSGKSKATTPDPVPSDESAIAKVEPPPVATTPTHHDPSPAPSPVVEAPPPSRAREVEPPAPPSRTREVEAPPAPRETVRESPPPRRTTSDEESARPRPSSEAPRPARNRVPRPTTDEEGGGTAAPETRLPDPSEAPAARPTIDQGALRAAFAEGEVKAKACLGATSPTGSARISVTFAPSGEAVGAIVSGAPFANTLEGQCMAAKFRTLHVPPFTGGEVIVRKSISFL